jgi:hypothetical protein
VKQVGRELSVGYMREGGARKAGNRIRVAAQLTEGEMYRRLAPALGQVGRTEEAQETLAKATAAAPARFSVLVRKRQSWVRLEGHNHMLEGLYKAGWEG